MSKIDKCGFILALGVLLFSVQGYSQLELVRDNATKKIGFTDAEGNWIVTPQYDEAEEFYGLLYAFVKKKNKWGLIDQSGKVILPFEYGKPSGDEGTRFRLVEKAGKHGLVDMEAAKESVACIYDLPLEMQPDISIGDEIRILVVRNNKAGEVDQYGKVLISCSYDVTEKPFDRVEAGGLIAMKEGLMGVIDKSDNVQVPFEYDEVTLNFSSADGWYTIKKSKKFGLYAPDKKREIAAPVYDKKISFDSQFALVSRKKKYGVIDMQGKEVVPCNFTMIEASEKLGLLEN